MRAVEKTPVGEHLSVSEAEAQEQQGNFKWGPFPIGVPPIGQVRTDRQCQGLEGEECNEKAEMAPKQARDLGPDRGAREYVGRERLSGFAARSGEREEHRDDRVDNRRRLLDSIGPFHQQEKYRHAANCPGEEQRRQQDKACKREGSTPAGVGAWPRLRRTRSRLERDNAADRDGAASLIVLRIGAVGGDNVDNEFVALVVETENVRRQTLTVVKGEDRDRAHVDFVQPLWEFCIRHFA